MDKHRRKILELVAWGRMTPAEAEWHWTAWVEAKMSDWMAAAAIVMGTVMTLHALLAHPAAAGTLRVIHQLWRGV